MRIKNLIIFISLCSILSITFGFGPNRTAWDTIPELSGQQKTTTDVPKTNAHVHVSNDTQNSSKTPEHEKTTESIFRRKSFPFSHVNLIKAITKFKSRFSRQEKVAKPITRKITESNSLNVILLLIDGLEQVIQQNVYSGLNDHENLVVQGFLKSCSSSDNFDYFHLGELKSDCDCEALLRSNVLSLLSWAHHANDMTTSAIHKLPAFYARGVEIDTESFMSFPVHRVERRSHGSWSLNERRKAKRSEHSTFSAEGAPFQPPANVSEGDSAWPGPDVAAKLRDAFFRALLASLNRNASAREPRRQDEEYRRYLERRRDPRQRHSNFRELAARVLEELSELEPNERGYALVASAEAEELPRALELLQRYVNSSNTLVVVTSSCGGGAAAGSSGPGPVPFYARGPGSLRLVADDPKYLFELPDAIRSVLGVCRDQGNDCSANVARGPSQPLPASSRPALDLGESPELPRARITRQDKAESGGNATQQTQQPSEVETTKEIETIVKNKQPDIKTTKEIETIVKNKQPDIKTTKEIETIVKNKQPDIKTTKEIETIVKNKQPDIKKSKEDLEIPPETKIKEKRNEHLKTKEIPIDINIELHKGETNGQEITRSSALTLNIITLFTVNYVIKF